MSSTAKVVAAGFLSFRLPDSSTCRVWSVRRLREELQLLQEPGSYVGEVIKPMGKTKVLVKVGKDAFLASG